MSYSDWCHFLLDSFFDKEAFHLFLKALTWKEYVQLHQTVPTCFYYGLKKKTYTLGFKEAHFTRYLK